MEKLLFITGNKHKLKEAREILKDIQILSLQDIGWEKEIDEPCPTLEENARHKAEVVHTQYGLSCFAEDTGLEVDHLHGDPGVYTARYAGETATPMDNIQLLLKNLEATENRVAQFRSVVHLITVGESNQFEGILSGQIHTSLQGEGGFGYDPIFIPDDYNLTLAQLPESIKNEISHRGLAMRKMMMNLISR